MGKGLTSSLTSPSHHCITPSPSFALSLTTLSSLSPQILDINIKAAALLVKEAHPYLKARGYGLGVAGTGSSGFSCHGKSSCSLFSPGMLQLCLSHLLLAMHPSL